MKKDIGVYLNDIKESISKIEEYTRDISQSDFFDKSEIQDAVVRRLEIIGEAVKNLPNDLKIQYPDIPWREIAGMRDILIHEYSGVNLGRVWKVIERDIPELRGKIETILRRHH